MKEESKIQVVSVGGRRRVRSDGTLTVACFKCGRIVSNIGNFKAATALCYECSTGNPQPVQVPIIDGRPRPDLMDEELLDALFEGEEKPVKKKKRFSPIDLAVGAFRVLTSRKKKLTPIIDKEEVDYGTADKESSIEIAKRKKRTPIFGKKEE